ncbi:hypothetical protein KP509_27G028300 [Ceratopteris richardii]|uniref:BHLH domain-containing protein n=1 Tax=Ceratopteris richardii TaxID=49495 RepID=A0A8T2RHE2_CERRI|nr:hypothetical protein KP509_27G028300 [Ceratopteris richardii]
MPQFSTQPFYDEERAKFSQWMHGRSENNYPPKMDKLNVEGALNDNVNSSVHSVDVPLQDPNFHDHEMFSWLHFPTEETIEKGLYADLFREFPSPSVQIVKHSFSQLGLQQEIPGGLQQEVATLSLDSSESLFNDVLPQNPVSSSFSASSSVPQNTIEEARTCNTWPAGFRSMVAGADAAMVVDRGAAATNIGTFYDGSSGILGQAQELPPISSSWQDTMFTTKRKSLGIIPPCDSDAALLGSVHKQCSSTLQEAFPLPTLRPLDAPLIASQSSSQRNFAHFSSAVAETRASLHVVGAGSGPCNVERARQQYAQGERGVAKDVQGPSQKESATVRLEIKNGKTAILQHACASSVSEHATESNWDKRTGEGDIVTSHCSSSAITASDKADKLHTIEQTGTSHSRGSGSSSDEKSGKETMTASKRRFSGNDDSECQSEQELEEVMDGSKKPMKRSRAAEMHNLCERKRRDRINEKLMALRELMPNSSKTAKASILDEAIEYVKLLQLQLQAWSARTGICIPPALTPNMGMQHLQVPAFPHMGLGMGVGMGVGLGMGMGMGMGIGMMDVNGSPMAAGRMMTPVVSYPSQLSSVPPHAMAPMQQCFPTMSAVQSQGHMQTTRFLDPCTIYGQNHQAQPSAMNLTSSRNMEPYNVYLQGHQQQYHQWQPLQQQQGHLIQEQNTQGNNANKPT